MTQAYSMELTLTPWAREDLAATSYLYTRLRIYFDSPKAYREFHLEAKLAELTTYLDSVIWLWPQGMPNNIVYHFLTILAGPDPKDILAGRALKDGLSFHSGDLSVNTHRMVQDFMSTHSQLQDLLAPVFKDEAFVADIPHLKEDLHYYVYMLRRLQNANLPKGLLNRIMAYIRPHEA